MYHARWAMIGLQAGMGSEDTYNPSDYAPQAVSLMNEIMQDANIAGLREGWNNLIKIEKIKEEAIKKADIKVKNGVSYYFGPEATHVPLNSDNLAWAREVDCYKCGEKLTSANNMMAIIRKTTNTDTLKRYVTVMQALLNEGEDVGTVQLSPVYGVVFRPSQAQVAAKKSNEAKSGTSSSSSGK